MNRSQEIRIADGLDKRCILRACPVEPICPWPGSPIGRDRPHRSAMTASCMLLSRVSSWRWLVCRAAKLSSRWQRVLVQRSRHLSDFVCRSFIDACGKISGGDSIGKLHDPLQARRGQVRGHGREYEDRDNKSDQQTQPDSVRRTYGKSAWPLRSR